MSLLGSIATIGGLAAGGTGLGILGNVAGSWATNSAKESLNKNVMKTNLKIQKQYDEWTQQQDKAYEQWWQNYLYGLQNKEYYNLAQKYATHTARWAVEGLKAAGLNPILAGIDSNLSSSMGNANPQASGHKVGGGSVRGASVTGGYNGGSVDLAGIMNKATAARMNEVNTEQGEIDRDVSKATKAARIEKSVLDTDLADAQVRGQNYTNNQILSNTAQTDAHAELLRAQAVKTAVDAVNAAKNKGMNGMSGTLFRYVSDLASKKDDTISMAGGRSLDDISDMAFRQVGHTGSNLHSAKDIGITVHRMGTLPWYRSEMEHYKDQMFTPKSDMNEELRKFHDRIRRNRK